MASAGASDAGQCIKSPKFGQIGGNGILHSMYSRMNVIATLQPWGKLWIRTTAPQINDKIASHCHGAGLVYALMHEVKHEVNSCSNAGAGVSLTVLDVKTIFEDSSRWGNPTKLLITQIVGGAGVSVKKTSAGGDQRSRADRDQLVAGTDAGLQPRYDCSLRLFIRA